MDVNIVVLKIQIIPHNVTFLHLEHTLFVTTLQTEHFSIYYIKLRYNYSVTE